MRSSQVPLPWAQKHAGKKVSGFVTQGELASSHFLAVGHRHVICPRKSQGIQTKHTCLGSVTDGLPPHSVVTTAHSEVEANPRSGTEVAGSALGLASLFPEPLMTSFPILSGGLLCHPMDDGPP